MVPEVANAVISLFAPVVISFLKDASWKGWQKRLLALAVSIAIVTAQAAYAFIWEKTAVEAAMRKSGVG